MAQPTAYTRQYNFNDFSTTSPSDPLPGVQVDNELNKVKSNLDGLNTNIALVQRDDGKLLNQSVHKNSFDVDALALIGLSGYTVSGNWAANTAYALGTLVDYNDATYLSTIAHTSGTVFATDLTAGKWILLANAAINTSGSAVDKFEGTGSQTQFTLSYTYSSTTDFLVFVNGALRNPNDDYTLSGTTLTLATPPSAPSVSGNENVIVWGANVAVESSKQAAATSASNASGFATSASNAKTAAETAKGLSEAARDLSIAAKDDSVTAKTASETAKGLSETAKTASETAKGLSETAKTASETAKGLSETAKTASESARDTAINYATKTDDEVPSTSDDSAKSWAVGGSGSHSMRTNGKGSAKEWAVHVAGTADGSDYSAKNYAIAGSALNAGSAKNWALGGGDSFSANTAVGNTGLYSAKYYAEQAAASKTEFSNIYHGASSSDPSGGTVGAGDLYFNTSVTKLKYYTGSAWLNVEATDTSDFAEKGFAIAMAIAL